MTNEPMTPAEWVRSQGGGIGDTIINPIGQRVEIEDIGMNVVVLASGVIWRRLASGLPCDVIKRPRPPRFTAEPGMCGLEGYQVTANIKDGDEYAGRISLHLLRADGKPDQSIVDDAAQLIADRLNAKGQVK